MADEAAPSIGYRRYTMGLLDTEARPRDTSFKHWPVIVGLLAAAATASLFSVPPAHRFSWTELLSSALEQLVSVSLVCVITTFALSVLRTRVRRPDLHLLNAMSLAAVWLVPLSLFIREDSALTIVVAGLFAVLATRLFADVERPDWNCSAPALIASLFPDEQPLFPVRRMEQFVAATFAAQLGVLSVFAGHTFVGAALLCIGFGVWTWFQTPNVASRRQSLSLSSSVLIAALAALFTIGGLIPYLRHSYSFAGFGVPSHRHSRHRYAHDGTTPQKTPTRTTADLESSGGEGHTGIVLWPDNQVVTRLVVPPPVSDLSRFTVGSATSPLVIPFNGVYWFFKAPDLQPPRSSRQAHASPELVEIRSTDRRPLLIEANDHLGALVGLGCCSRIQIAIRNADRYPETVWLELIVIDTTVPQKPSQSLGRMMVRSTRPWNIFEKPTPVTETLNFVVPRYSALRRFDEIKIVFHLDRARADAAAKIGIDHFVLVPRGG